MMKRHTRLLIALSATLCVQVLHAQNVGINNTSPGYPLHVNQPADSSLTSGIPIIFGEYQGTNYADVVGVQGYSRPQDYYGVGGSFEGGWIGVRGNVFPTGGSLYTGVTGYVSGGTGINYGIYGSAYGSGTNWAGYFDGGNVFVQNKVGIGQPVPQWPLDMSASQAVVRMLTISSANGSVIELKNTATSPTLLGAINFNNAGDTYPGQIAYGGDNKLKFRTNGVEQMVLDQNGNLNIGTSSFIGIRLNVDGGLGKFNQGVVAYDFTGGSETIALYGSAGGGSNNNWAGYFSDGNVYVKNQLRIGTTTGATGYLVSVKGKMICEELKIQLQANWPDYVFSDTYQLPSLYILEQDISNLGHLPGIPSAEEVRTSGIEVGEIQRRMMEKIEELTRYVIDLQHQNDRLQKEVDHLNSVIRGQNEQQ